MHIILICLLIWYIYSITKSDETTIVSNVDGKSYAVKNFEDRQEASDTLAKLNQINETMIIHLKKKYGDSKEIDTNYLSKNYRVSNVSENIPTLGGSTSYVFNKGDMYKVCIRDIDTNDIQDFNTLTFVNLHELTHLLDKGYAHSKTFWKLFKIVLTEAVSLGLYIPVDYRKYPVRYCGMTIYSSPLYE